MTGAGSVARAGRWKGIRRKLVKSMPYYALILAAYDAQYK